MNMIDNPAYKLFSVILVAIVLLIVFGLVLAALLGVWHLVAWLWVMMI